MPVDLVVSWHRAFHLIHVDHLMTTDPRDPYYGQNHDNGMIENAYPADPPEEGIDFVEDDVTQADGTTRRMIIRRPRP